MGQNGYIFILVFRMLDALIIGASAAEPSGFLWRVCVHTHVCVYMHLTDLRKTRSQHLYFYLQTVCIPARRSLQTVVNVSTLSLAHGK